MGIAQRRDRGPDGDELADGVLAYKLVAAAAHLGSGAVIYQIARKLDRQPRRVQASVYVFLWNPLLLWEMVGNAHNDGLMVLFGLIGVWLYVAGHDLLALLCIAAGALVKVADRADRAGACSSARCDATGSRPSKARCWDWRWRSSCIGPSGRGPRR